MNRIVLTGDTHGVLDTQKIDNFQHSAKRLDINDYLIICGDCGIVWDKETIKDSIEYFQGFGTNILFIDGNHENFDLLNAYPVTKWNGGKVHKLGNGVYHLMRGQVFDICGKKIFTIGGADSTDREVRKEHLSWWKEETVTMADIIESLENLAKYDYTVDYVISHSPNNDCLKLLYDMFTQCGEDVPYYLKDKLSRTTSSNNLQELVGKISFKKWFCGHLHIDEVVEKYQVLYNSMKEI